MVPFGGAADGDFLLTDCLLFGAIISATDPGSWPYKGTPTVTLIPSSGNIDFVLNTTRFIQIQTSDSSCRILLSFSRLTLYCFTTQAKRKKKECLALAHSEYVTGICFR